MNSLGDYLNSKSVYTSRFMTYNNFSSVLTESEGVELNGFYRANTRIN